MVERNTNFTSSLVAGGTAGFAVDTVLFPLDTVKTRLQSGAGFFIVGGFRGIYSGLGSVAVGSVPSAALFFCSYDTFKRLFLKDEMSESQTAIVSCFAATFGEISACTIRVPVEVVKQRAQTMPKFSSLQIFRLTIQNDGFKGLYRGYLSTVIKDIPFSLIQFPLWEYLKSKWSKRRGKYVNSLQSAVCGAIAGGIAAGITTPLDVAKTRIMLAKSGSEFSQGYVPHVLWKIWMQEGFTRLFSGIVPRVLGISFGGAIFLGVYEKIMEVIHS